ncbi:precorrin-6x reductase [Desulfosporosinus acidiphilus SJ4]|uniref:Precorrin-6x reductase n=1 Tax=Desulfosporosinus acidiphilus (strain DSM 22704 / JCM 16185 / SJ4) TaxID=646529 RepID=I4D1Y9_DESAJ|nr:precorrin-6A/cobalt-precorrin-6A reductase [Desulfosporosinus acidiphilus]AFM39813.1 precorrin-6x reductase [Desulfosporosinus acidiphilus SJ4]
MIILLGESVLTREINTQLMARKLEVVRRQNWTAETCISSPPALVIDASHPSMSTKFASCRSWCEEMKIPYIRLERPETKIPSSPLIFPVFDWEEALLRLEQRIEFLRVQKKHLLTVFITTGSHQLQTITKSSFANSVRLVARILPDGRLVQKCQEAGLHPRDIVAMQGPFSKEINKALFKFYGADIILTRDSGLAGGTDTKISAALELGLEIVLVRKAKTNNGLTVNSPQELLAWIDQKFSGTPSMTI